ncbi:hypothetical protein ACFC60_10555 [Kitasatospora purpeofusca]|uniref:hypothetical protein n=1 Tax=Kitasatospora purpeofusca TaxID=67352 RepID=UPI0035E2E130
MTTDGSRLPVDFLLAADAEPESTAAATAQLTFDFRYRQVTYRRPHQARIALGSTGILCLNSEDTPVTLEEASPVRAELRGWTAT